ncbi:serine hydrolase domain-containing protein [Pseudomonas matsuisoli]|uniref:6-aminohexanoate-dimer hydrolase n=1 Tax=Pseudomonas matsuisoli TaxID=1515666 RepID=A0A917PNW7_9PSED|nr:serine hydrolase [Pseudomonas matsuisoli]GGJ85401.1 6-aminohexanoate-dimer hydrolase [Pseudomonas matsuisoli]
MTLCFLRRSSRARWLVLACTLIPFHAFAARDALDRVLADAAALAPLQTVALAQDGQIVAERGYRGHRTTDATNIKSASKSVIATLVGIAIDKGVLEGPDQHVVDLLKADLPANADPRLQDVTLGNLLSMQAGLGSTSGQNYGAWVASRNWVRAALARPFLDAPGGAMIYSTGSTHLLSAILTRRTGRSTWQLAREWLGPLDGFAITAWSRDPQGVYLGGNEMAMSTRSLLAFGELYRNGGRASDGTRLLSQSWIDAAWTPRTRSRYTGDGYGYGWFITRKADENVRYGWGYGGQMIYVAPDIGLTVAMTSSAQPSGGQLGHREDLHRLLERIIVAVKDDSAQGGSESGT